MQYKVISSETNGSFLTNPSVQTLKQIKADDRILASITYEVTDDDDNQLYKIKIEEYFDDKVIVTTKPTVENPYESEINIEPGPLQTKIIISCPGTDEEAKKKLSALNQYLAKGFYAQHPYTAVLCSFGYSVQNPYLQIAKIAPLFADTIWNGLQSYPEFKVPAELIVELQARTYPRAYVGSEEKIYTDIKDLVDSSKYKEAVDLAYDIARAPDAHGYPSMSCDYLYQTGIWLKDKSVAESNRAFRLLSGMDSHCLHLLAKKQLSEVAAEKLSDPLLYGAARVAWSRSLVNTGLAEATSSGDAQDAFIEAVKAVATQDGSIEMSGTPGTESYSIAVNAALNKLKGRNFDGSSLAGTALAGMETSGEIEMGFAMMQALMEGLGAAIEEVSKDGATAAPSAKPKPRG